MTPIAGPHHAPRWTLEPGDTILRKDLHQRFGGGGQGGIEPSARTPNVFIFSDRDAGKKYGYMYDRWSDGVFHFTGDGQVGDQVMKYGNRAILEHRKQRRALRVFDGVRGNVTYQGEFELAADPFYIAEARDRFSERARKVIVFRLIAVGAAITDH
jgi:hypothetical protein